MHFTPSPKDTSVIVITLNRPDCVKRCLDCLSALNQAPGQIIIVDASADTLTRDICREFEQVLYVRNENGPGHMTQSRNIGLKFATGRIIAFIDDDAFVEPTWLENLLTGYSDPKVGAVGGRALNPQPNEENISADQIGKLRNNGVILGNFDVDPGRTIEVDHIIGCNMSFRSDVLARLGGFREICTGVSGVSEDTDMSLRVGRAGYKLVFVPSAVLLHIGAPQVKGRRFDFRWQFHGYKNFTCMLTSNYGPMSGLFVRYLVRTTYVAFLTCCKKIAACLLNFVAQVAGIVLGIWLGTVIIAKTGMNPERNDPEAQELRRTLLAARESQSSASPLVETSR
jgi:GT2 family glycosyltransferase